MIFAPFANFSLKKVNEQITSTMISVASFVTNVQKVQLQTIPMFSRLTVQKNQNEQIIINIKYNACTANIRCQSPKYENVF